MRKLILVAHTSLDGYVANIKGELSGFDFSEENLCFVVSLTESADAALFGRISYELLDAYWPTAQDLADASTGTIAYATWYNQAQKIVISKTLTEKNSARTVVINEDVANAVRQIKNEPGKDILIFGSPAITQILMDHDLIDSYWIFINPVIFGEGIPLFVPTTHKEKLKLVDTKQFPNGELALNYIVQG